VPAATAQLTPPARRFLETPGRYAVVTTLGEDGMPHQAVVWYRLDGETLLINSRLGRRWPAELLADPRIAFTVHDGTDYVTLQGEAEVVAEGATALRDIQDLARRYGDDPAGFEGQQRISFRIRPRAIGYHGQVS
jgi:PPOX class probable F420-dependent enzyme